MAVILCANVGKTWLVYTKLRKGRLKTVVEFKLCIFDRLPTNVGHFTRKQYNCVGAIAAEKRNDCRTNSRNPFRKMPEFTIMDNFLVDQEIHGADDSQI
jgi:hypothetical protein